ncbi:MAG: response regulator [Rhodospirillaceae bacterium]|nr:response regulator [Rhodospirillales bacterium]MBT3906215.1 response regulator [Rhodospirillaceae bacterium]MBT4700045.1 response regulator [Rhodospirillaceae bacterium]MBT5034709.1 response regulator [Rhodospirillaceae bacterium]MBT6221490.1 response regulator [Rhodospirillaceae bacterium]
MNTDMPHILAVDDDDRLRELLRKFLSENGFRVSAARDAADARIKLAALEFDLMVLDLMMPGENGLDFAADLRKTSSIPILMLTAMAETEDRITGLEKGADDYLTKPFEPRELLLRINNILRRQPDPIEDLSDIQMGDVVFDRTHDTLSREGDLIRLTSVEAALLKVLAEQPNLVLSREELIDRTGAAGGGRAVDVQVTRLRRKIEQDPKLPRYLQTVRGKGYVLRPD